MRDARQIGSTVGEYHDWQRAERQRNLRAALAILRRAREDGEPWYGWVLELRRRRLEGLPPVPPTVSDELELT